jgi:NitT/TauT family transport system substrate-binding protein
MNRKTIFIAFFVAIMLLGFFARSGVVQKRPLQHGSPAKEITIGAFDGEYAAPIWIAEAKGFFAGNGLRVRIENYDSGKDACQALLQAKVDVVTMEEFVLVQNSFTHHDLRVLATIDTSETDELIARKDHGIRYLSDLKGKRIGVTGGTSGEFFLKLFLTFNNLSFREMNIVDLAPSQMLDAITKGEVDAVDTWEPIASAVKNRLGTNALVWSSQGVRQSRYVLAVGTRDWIKEDPETVEKFLTALFQAVTFMREHASEAKDIISNRFHYEPSYLDRIWSKHDFVLTLSQSLVMLMEDEARWIVESRAASGNKKPNYLEFIYLDGLKRVAPEAVTLFDQKKTL